MTTAEYNDMPVEIRRCLEDLLIDRRVCMAEWGRRSITIRIISSLTLPASCLSRLSECEAFLELRMGPATELKFAL